MEEDIWKQCPSSTNAVECRNRECKSDTPQCLKLAMMKVYKFDKLACLKHIAAERFRSVIQIEDRRSPENGSHNQTKSKNEVHSIQLLIVHSMDHQTAFITSTVHYHR